MRPRERKRNKQLSTLTLQCTVPDSRTQKYHYKSVKFHPGIWTRNPNRSDSVINGQLNWEKRTQNTGEFHQNKFVLRLREMMLGVKEKYEMKNESQESSFFQTLSKGLDYPKYKGAWEYESHGRREEELMWNKGISRFDFILERLENQSKMKGNLKDSSWRRVDKYSAWSGKTHQKHKSNSLLLVQGVMKWHNLELILTKLMKERAMSKLTQCRKSLDMADKNKHLLNSFPLFKVNCQKL